MISSTTTINDLPEEILIRVLACLDTPQAARTSVLATKWRELWKCVPFLHFDIKVAYKSSPPAVYRETRDRFYTQVSRYFEEQIDHNYSRLQLDFHNSDAGNHEKEVWAWIRRAVSKAKEIKLKVYKLHWMAREQDDLHVTFIYPFWLLFPGQVTKLALQSCVVVLPEMHIKDVRCETLKTLDLYDVGVLFDQDFANIFISCVNLEDVNLDMIRITCGRHISIVSNTLKKLFICDLKNGANDGMSLEIDAPVLISLGMIDFRPTTRTLHLSPEHMHLDIHFFEDECTTILPYKKLQHLELLTGFAEEDLFGIFDVLRRTSHVETLVLDHQYQNPNPAEIRPDSLGIDYQPDFVPLSMPKLRHVELRNYRGTEHELCVVRVLKKAAIPLASFIGRPHGKSTRISITL